MKEEIICYIGKSGKEYPYNEYLNHGYGGLKNNKYKDLPKEDYPYTLKYKSYRSPK